MDLDVVLIPRLVAGVATLVFGIVIVGMSPRSSLHRAFGLFCGLRGGMLTLRAFSSPFDDVQGRMSVYLLMAVPFAAIWLAHQFLRSDRRDRPVDLRLAWLLVGGTLALEALYLFDHRLYFGGSSPLALINTLQFACYGAVAFVVAGRYRSCPPGPRRRSLYPLALAIMAEPTYWTTFNLFDFAKDAGLVPRLHLVLLLAGLALCAATAWRVALLGRSVDDRLDRWRFLCVAGIAAATGFGSAGAAALGFGLIGPFPLLVVFNAFWTLFLVAATAYAIIRYRLFTIDLRVKAFLRYGSLAVLEGGLFVILSEALEERVASQGIASVAAALVIAAALYPIGRLTRQMADRLMPGVAHTDEYRTRRRREIYRAALQRALLDGTISRDEKLALDTLWKALGLSGKEARELEREIRPAAASPRAQHGGT